MGSFRMGFHVTGVPMDLTGIVLSGGSSRRMGRDKAMLSVGSVTSIERTVLSLRTVCKEVLISISNPKPYDFLGLKTVKDIYIGKGPMAGLHACLNKTETAWNMVVACDMPFVSSATMRALIQIAAGDMTRETEVEKARAELPDDLRAESGRTELDAVMPVVGGKPQPLFALYHRDVQTSLANCLSRDELRMMDWLAQLHVLYVPVEDLSQLVGRETIRDLFNMNGPEDYVTACKWVEESTSGDIS